VPKRLDVMLQLVPKATVIGMIVNPNGVQAAFQIQEMEEATRSRGLALHIARRAMIVNWMRRSRPFLNREPTRFVEGSDPLFIDMRRHIVALRSATEFHDVL